MTAPACDKCGRARGHYAYCPLRPKKAHELTPDELVQRIEAVTKRRRAADGTRITRKGAPDKRSKRVLVQTHVSSAVHRWLRAEAALLGLTLDSVLRLRLTDAMRAGWRRARRREQRGS